MMSGEEKTAMSASVFLLLLTAAGVAAAHTILGVDHYLPFAAMARAFRWSRSKLLVITLLCGVGHVLSSALLGLVGIALGITLASLRSIESTRGQIAAWGLLAFGLVYFAWGMRRALRHRPHQHVHVHQNGTVHAHTHVHQHDHLHVHATPGQAARSVTPWMLFTLFLLGPCEPLIPLLMVPAAAKSWLGVGLVTLVFGVVTLITMAAGALACASGMQLLPVQTLERYSHALAGALITMCGVAIQVFHI